MFEYINDDFVKESFSERLKILRESIGATQGEFADRIGVSRQAISFYEKGERVPDICIFDRILQVTGCSPYYLLGIHSSMADRHASLAEETGLSDSACSLLFANCDSSLDAMELLLSSESFWKFLKYIGFAQDGWTIYKEDKSFDNAYFRFKTHALIDQIINDAENYARLHVKEKIDSFTKDNQSIECEMIEDRVFSDPYGVLDERISKFKREVEEFLNQAESNRTKAEEKAEAFSRKRLKEIEEDKFENFKAKLHKYGPYRENNY